MRGLGYAARMASPATPVEASTRRKRSYTPAIPLAVLALLVAAAALAIRLGLVSAHPFGLFADTTPQSGEDAGNVPAPNFTLSDQDGKTISMGALRGKAVVVSFFYTNCPDTCPLTAAKLAQAERQLSPSDRARLQLLAVSVDPRRDTVQARKSFVDQHHLSGEFSYLSASQTTLSPIWRGYAIGVSTTPDPKMPGGYDVEHTSVSYLVDPQGRERVLIDDNSFTPDQLVHDVRMVLGES